MAWARLDDLRADNPKLMAAGFEARGLDEAAICWCSGHSTDGFVSTEAVAMLSRGHHCRAWTRVVKRLVDVGRWIPAEGGWWIHDYLDYNPSRAEQEAAREAKVQAGRVGGLKSGQARRKAGASSNGEAHASSRSEASASSTVEPPSRPVPLGIKSSSSSNARGDPAGDDDDDPTGIQGHAIAILVSRHMTAARLGGVNIVNPFAYAEVTRNRLETIHASRFAAAPDFDDNAYRLADWLEPPTPPKPLNGVEQTAVAAQAIMTRNDHPCPHCVNGWLEAEEVPGGFTVSPCPQCQEAQP